MMKRSSIRTTGIILVIITMFSCYNREKIFPDFDYTTAYFPYQYPIRTLVLGDYVFDNTNDNQWKFIINANMGGVYENKKNYMINFKVDEALTDSLYIGTKKLLPLPQSYYTLSHNSEIAIPKGQFHGGVEVQLTEAFFNDAESIGHFGTTYVVPLVITGATTDSVLQGKSELSDPDRRVPGDWETRPMDFTIFGINYVNEYHGNYLLKGRSQVVDGGNVIETNIYSNKYVEYNEVVQVNTSARHTVKYIHRVVRASGFSPGLYEMVITFDAGGNGTIVKGAYPLDVNGTARFVKNAETWGGKERHAIYLNYQVNDGDYLHNGVDTLIFRDKGVSYQVYVPTVNQ